MGENTGIAPAQVVNLADYRAARAAARTLPLFCGPEAAAGPETVPAPPSLPARPLRPREIAHRERMLRHLAGR